MFCKIYRDFMTFKEISLKCPLISVKRAGEKISVKSKIGQEKKYL